MDKIDSIRAIALEHADKTRRSLRLAIFAVASIEAVSLLLYIIAMNPEVRTHWLILIAAVMTYAQIGIGLLYLGRYIKVSTLQVLKAIEVEYSGD